MTTATGPVVLTHEQQAVLATSIRLAHRWDAYLVGGMALALHLGHRRSADFDWFTPKTLARRRGPERPLSPAQAGSVRLGPQLEQRLLEGKPAHRGNGKGRRQCGTKKTTAVDEGSIRNRPVPG